MIRLFVAVDLSDEIKNQLNSICFGVPGAKWVAVEQRHLTVRFIGKVDGAMFKDTREMLANVRCEPFMIRLKGLGHFPLRKIVRVLWIGVEPGEGVALLRNRVESALAKIGLASERRKFSPHITLARLRDTPISKVMQFFEDNGLFTTITFQISAFHLYSSVLTSKGAIHQRQATYDLVNQ